MKNLSKVLVIFLSFSLAACLPNFKKDDKPQIRIVDLNGKERKVTTRYPELNVPALNSQGKAYEKTSQGAFTNSIKVSSSPTYVKKEISEEETPASVSEAPQNLAADSVVNLPPNNSNIENGIAKSQVDEVVEYDLGNSAAEVFGQKAAAKEKKIPQEKIVKSKSNKAVATKKKSTRGKYFVQVGSFSNRVGAEAVLKKMQKFHSGTIETSSGDRVLYRVWLGPFTNKTQAQKLVKKITKSGSAAILVKGK